MVPNRYGDFFLANKQKLESRYTMCNSNESSIVLIIKYKHILMFISWYSIIKMSEHYHWCFL